MIFLAFFGKLFMGIILPFRDFKNHREVYPILNLQKACYAIIMTSTDSKKTKISKLFPNPYNRDPIFVLLSKKLCYILIFPIIFYFIPLLISIYKNTFSFASKVKVDYPFLEYITDLRISNRKIISMVNLMREYMTTIIFVNDAVCDKAQQGVF
jgi:hypothetical protein